MDEEEKDFARNLRRESTPAERKLWRLLRDRRLDGFKFRRQVHIEPYYADFLCFKCKLILEADGYMHENRQLHDAVRDAFLKTHGYQVMRFTNLDIYHSAELVVAQILEVCESRLAMRNASSDLIDDLRSD